jgi:mannosyltransferase OCH1-like enzyme
MGLGAVPKIIHQIWIGRDPRPNEWMDTVKDFAVRYGYKYMLWDEGDVDALGLDTVPGVRDVYENFGHELAGKADILRMLCLYKYGGIYIDADTVIMKPEKFDAFLQKNRAAVFFGWENLTVARTRKLNVSDPGIKRTRRLVANGLIGSERGHPFFKRLLQGIEGNTLSLDVSEKKVAWKTVGPLYVTRMYHATRKDFPDVHIYPMKYFYPMHWGGITDPELHKKVKIPGKSMLFQYGYSTNKFDKIFKREAKRMTRKKSRV